MTAPGAKSGPLSQEDIQAIWDGTNDPGFTQGFEQAGEGAGFEAYTQMFAQMARVSEAVDVTTQAMYILPSSGQSNPPAPGWKNATVELTFSRAQGNPFTNWPIIIAAGTTFVQEQQNDWGDSGSTAVLTGRRYLVTQTLVIPPGDLGPYTVQATAEFPGFTFNNPLPAYTTAAGVEVPASISVIAQPGDAFFHDRASIYLTPAGAPIAPPAVGPLPQSAIATLVAINEADQFIPGHVGQYVLMTAGANVGKVGRITGYLPPGTSAPASAVTLAFDQCVEVAGVTGTFVPGEIITFSNAGTRVATGMVLAATPGSAAGVQRLTYVLQTGTAASGDAVTGGSSGATATLATFLQQLTWIAAGTVPPSPTQLAGAGENWRILDWVEDLGLSVTHTESPSGGTTGMLDELGYERGMPGRGGGETDDAYRKRVAQVADTVSPNAIARVVTRALGGTPGEVLDTQTGLDGFFYDRIADTDGDFYDTSCLEMQLGSPFSANPYTVTSASNTIPIVLGLSSVVGVRIGMQVTVSGVGGNTAANGTWVISDIAGFPTNTVTLQGSAGNGAYTSGGSTLLSYPAGTPFRWVDANGLLVAMGFFGSLVPGSPSSAFMTFRGGPENLPPLRTTFQAGDQLQFITESGVTTPTVPPVPTTVPLLGVTVPACFTSKLFRVYLDYTEFRAFFLIGVSSSDAGEMGFYWDSKPAALSLEVNPYDLPDAFSGCFYDGYPRTAWQLDAQVWSAANAARAGGVGLDLFIESQL